MQGVDSGVNFGDPVVVYNESTQKFLIGALDFHRDANAKNADSRFDVAISKTNSPTLSADDWFFFHYDTDDNPNPPAGGVNNVNYSDYPKIGFTADGYVVSFNMFADATVTHVSVLGIRNDGTSTGMRTISIGSNDFTFAPASQHSNATGAPMWFVEDGHAGHGGDSVTVIRLDNPFSSSAVITSRTTISVTPYLDTPDTQQPPNPLSPNTKSFVETVLGTRFYFSALRTVGGITHLVAAHTVGSALGPNVPSSSPSFSYTPATRTAKWVYAAGALSADQYLLELSAVVTGVAGNALDGEWTNPFSRETTNPLVSKFPSGNGVAGGPFRFVFTILPGDANLSNDVSGNDFLIIQQNLGLTGRTFTQGDFNNTGTTTSADTAIYTANYGRYFYVLIFADYNHTGVVTVTDKAIQNANLNSTSATHAMGDVDGDGDVDLTDVAITDNQQLLRLSWVA